MNAPARVCSNSIRFSLSLCLSVCLLCAALGEKRELARQLANSPAEARIELPTTASGAGTKVDNPSGPARVDLKRRPAIEFIESPPQASGLRAPARRRLDPHRSSCHLAAARGARAVCKVC